MSEVAIAEPIDVECPVDFPLHADKVLVALLERALDGLQRAIDVILDLTNMFELINGLLRYIVRFGGLLNSDYLTHPIYIALVDNTCESVLHELFIVTVEEAKPLE